MAYEQKDNEGVLFKNDKKETDKHPDYKGWGKVSGTEVWIAAWIKEGKNGKFMSLSIRPKDAERLDGKRAGEKPTAANMRDDIPF